MEVSYQTFESHETVLSILKEMRYGCLDKSRYYMCFPRSNNDKDIHMQFQMCQKCGGYDKYHIPMTKKNESCTCNCGFVDEDESYLEFNNFVFAFRDTMEEIKKKRKN